jgi:hypothetical protein
VLLLHDCQPRWWLHVLLDEQFFVLDAVAKHFIPKRMLRWPSSRLEALL